MFTLRRSRPRALVAGALTVLALAVAGCGGGDDEAAGPDDKVTLRYSWWGPAERAELMQKAIKLFQAKYPNVSITPNFSEYAPYWQKLATETAGGGAPDVLQMDFTYLREYADRGVLLDLGEQLDKKNLKIDGLLPGLKDAGIVEEKRYAVAISGNAFSLTYDPAAFQQAGVKIPTTWTWEQYREAVGKVTDATDLYGAADYTSIMGVAELQFRQQGKRLLGDDGKVGVTKEELKAFWRQGEELRKNSWVVPQAKVEQVKPETVIGADLAASAFAVDSFLTRYTGETKRKIALAPVPTSNPADTGQVYRPGILLSASAKTKYPVQAAQLIDFMINDPEVGKIFGGNRGLPATTAQREAAAAGLSEQDQAVAAYEKTIAAQLKTPASLPPKGAGTVDQLFLRLGEDLGHGRITVDQAVDQFFEGAEKAMR